MNNSVYALLIFLFVIYELLTCLFIVYMVIIFFFPGYPLLFNILYTVSYRWFMYIVYICLWFVDLKIMWHWPLIVGLCNILVFLFSVSILFV